MSKPPKVKVFNPNSAEELEKKRVAKERARRVTKGSRGIAANILASSDTFGSSASARSGLGGAGLLG